ncbi:MAG: MFS family permease [Candidatus Azotimanducaceae bacterium]|jgi:MFS family permease
MSELSRAERHAEQRYDIFVQRNLTRNFFAHLAHGMFGQTGFRFINAPTFIPAYLLLLSGGSNLVVGLAMALQGFGQMLTPMVGANLISHRQRVLPLGFLVGSGMRLSVLGMGLAGFFLDQQGTLIAMICLLGLFGLFEGMQGVIFNFLMSKVIPVKKRGRLTGLRNFLAGITAAVVAYIGGTYLIGESNALAGYSWTFILAFVLTSFGLLTLTLVREPQPPTVMTQVSLLQQLRSVPEFLRSDRAFTRYFIARAIATTGRMAMPFYILYAGNSIGLTGVTLGIVTFAFTIAGTVSNLIWGAIADARGFRLVFITSTLLWVISSAVLLIQPGYALTIIIFAGIGAASQGFENSSRNIVLEFGDRRTTPTRIAIANTASQVTGSLGPLLGGVMATFLGYESVFVVAILFLLLGAGMVQLFVPEPRTRQP